MLRSAHKIIVGFSALVVMMLCAQTSVAGEYEFVDAIRSLQGQPRGVAIDPDGRHLYTTESRDNGVGIYRIEPDSGRLQFVAVLQNRDLGLRYLQRPVEIIVSPDGRHVYVACKGNVYDYVRPDHLVVFARDKGSGHLVHVETLSEVSTGTGLAISPDGRHFYVSMHWKSSVAFYSRDVVTGKLTFKQDLRNGVAGITGLRLPSDLVLSPDGASIYAVSEKDSSVVVFRRNQSAGWMSHVATYFNGQSGIHGMDSPKKIALSPDGQSLYVTGAESIVLFNRDPVTGELAFEQSLNDGIGGVSNLVGPQSVVVSADGAGVAVVALESNALVVFERDQSTGRLSFIEAHVNADAGVSGMVEPMRLVSSPEDSHLYVGTLSGAGVSVFQYDSQISAASFIESNQEMALVPGLLEPLDIEVSSDDAYLYVANERSSSVVVLSRNPTGHLAFVQRLKDGFNDVEGIRYASRLALSPDDKHLYVASGYYGDSTIGVFRRNETDGTLSFANWIEQGNLWRTYGLEVSHDGAQLYTVRSSNLAVFNRHSDSGELTFLEVHIDGELGVDGLSGARDLTMSSDDRHIYVAASGDDAISVFQRDTSTGALTFVQVVEDGVDGVTGLNSPGCLALSENGQHLYVAAYQSLVVFERNAQAGELVFVEAWENGDGGTSGLSHADSIAVTTEGSRVVVNSKYYLVIFARNPSTGTLTFVEAHDLREDDVGPVLGFGQSRNAEDLFVLGEFWGRKYFDNYVAAYRSWRAAADGVPGEIQVIDGRQLQVIDVEPCAQQLTVELTGLSANLDLSTRFGEPPTTSDFDCRSDQTGTQSEMCVHASPSAGPWWIAANTVDFTGSPVDATLTATIEGCDGHNQVSWWRADGDTGDALGLNDGIAEGGLSYAPAVVDQGFVAAANGDAVVVPSDVSLDVGESDFSYSMWVQTTDRRPFRSLLDSRTIDPVTGALLFVDAGKPGVQVADGADITTTIGRKDVADGRFHHLTVSVDRDSPQGLTLWVDRKLDTVMRQPSSLGPVSSLEGLTFARRTDATSGEGFFNGMIDEVRFSKRAVSRREAVDIFGGLRSWWPGDGDTSDHGGVNHAVGSPSYIQGRRGLGFGFGVAPDDQLVVPHHESLDFGTGDLSIVCWVETEQSTGEQIVLDSRKTGPGGFALAVADGKPKLYLADGTESAAFVADQTVADSAYHMVAVTVDRDSTDGVSFWIDGVLAQTFDPTAVAGSIDSGEAVTIGRSTDAMGAQHQFQGLVDELELYERVLTEREIGWLFDDSAGLFFLGGFELGDASGWSATSP